MSEGTLIPCRRIPFDAVGPDVVLSRWRIFETDDGSTHLVGFDTTNSGCVSSVLISLNFKTMLAETIDGLSYRLVGKQGWFWDVVDVWDFWFDANSAGVVKDVTERLLAEAAVADDA